VHAETLQRHRASVVWLRTAWLGHLGS